jgi:hypothetical protein
MNLLTTRYTRDSVQINGFRLQIYTILEESITEALTRHEHTGTYLTLFLQ